MSGAEDERRAEIARLHARLRELGDTPGGVGRVAGGSPSSTPAGREELFAAVESTRMAMILTDPSQPDEPIIFANRAFQMLTGYPAEELLGRNCRFLQGPDTDPAAVERLHEAVRSDHDVAVEILNYRRDGTPFLNELFISPVFDRTGRLLYRFGSQLDVTDVRQDLRRLEAGARQQRAIFDSAVDIAIIATDRDNRVTDWNAGAERVFGWSAAEMRGENVGQLFTPDDRADDRITLESRRALERGRVASERWHLRRDGSRFWGSGEMMPLRAEHGEHLGFIKVIRDRTEQHLAGRALELMNERYFLAQRAARDALWDLDVATGRVRWNEALHVQYGWDVAATDTTVQWWFERLHPDDRDRVERSIEAVLRDGDAWTGEYRFRRADGGYADVLDRGYLIRDESGQPTRMVGAMFDQTALRRADAALRDRDDRLRLAAAAAGLGTFDHRLVSSAMPRSREGGIGGTDADTTATSRVEMLWDDRCRDLFGLPPDAPVDYEASFLSRLHPDDRARVEAVLRRSRAGAGAGRFSVEYRVRHRPDGAPRWVAAAGETHFADGVAVRQVGTMLDITGRRRVEDALRDSERRYRTLFETMDEGFCVIEFLDGPHGPLSDYVHVEANLAYARHAGITDVVGQRLREMVPAEAEGWLERYRPVLLTGEPIRFEQELVATGRHLELSAFRIEPASRRQVAVLFQDVTERQRAAAVLEALNTRLEQQLAERTRERDRFWHLSRDALVIADAEGRWLQASPAWTGLLGWREDELTGRTPDWLEHPDNRGDTGRATRAVLAGTGPNQFESCFRTRGGAWRWFSWTATGTGDGLSYGVARDITELKAQDENRVRLEDQLRQSQKMEAVGQLTGGIAHDFNNLLTGISGALELLGNRLASRRLDGAERYVSAAQDSARRAAALTHRLLAFSRRQTLDPRPTDLDRLVADMEELIRRTVGPAITLRADTEPGLWPILVDPNQLENALLNLCINARDAMPDGGTLVIATTNHGLDASAAAERDLDAGDYVSLRVTDTGSGMEPDVIHKAFDPFFTTKPIGQGTGLGLSMIYGFARQSDGGVHIASTPGHGTAVQLLLPRYRGDMRTADLASVPPPVPDPPVGPGGGYVVLVVDDELTVRHLVVEVLEELGYVPLQAADGASGLRILRSGVRIDLLVTDVGLPGGMNGRQLADAARVQRPGLKALFITGYAETAVIGDDQLGPGMHVMTKPFALDALAARIRTLVAPGA